MHGNRFDCYLCGMEEKNVPQRRQADRQGLHNQDFLLKEEVATILKKEEISGEKANYKFRWGMLLMLLAFAVVNVFTKRFTMTTTLFQFLLLSVAFAYQIVLFFLFRADKYHISLMYISVTIDLTLISAMLLVYFYHDHILGPITTALILVYLIIIAIAGARHSIALSWYAGFLAAAQYFVISLITQSPVKAYTARLLELTKSVTGLTNFKLPSGDFTGQLFKAVYIAFAGGVIAYLSRKTQTMVQRMAVVSSEKQQAEIEAMQLDFQRRTLQDMFGKYVDKRLADQLLGEEINLEGEKREVSVLFIDIRGFTALSQKNEPEQIIKFLNRFFSCLAAVVSSHDGFINKFIGDAMMVVYGAPLEERDHAEKAICSAIDMLEEVDKRNQEFNDIVGQNIQVGISICSGQVIAGNIGSSERMEYTIIGDTVNMASRLEGLNKRFKCHLIIDQPTHDKVRDLIHVREEHQVKVRGSERPLTIYIVEGYASGACTT